MQVQTSKWTKTTKGSRFIIILIKEIDCDPQVNENEPNGLHNEQTY